MTEFPDKTFITNDLSFSAYLVMHDIKLLLAQRLGKSYKFQFTMSPEIERLKLSYVGSESSRFDDSVRKLKRVLFSDNGSHSED